MEWYKSEKKDTKAASVFDVLDLDIFSMSTGNLFVELFRPVTLLWLRLFKRKYFQKIELQITKCQLNIIINSSKYFSLVNRKQPHSSNRNKSMTVSFLKPSYFKYFNLAFPNIFVFLIKVYFYEYLLRNTNRLEMSGLDVQGCSCS